RRYVGPFRRDERPVLLPGCSLLDPSREQCDLPLAEGLAGRRAVLTAGHAPDHLTVCGVAGNDREPAILQRALGALFLIEPERRHLRPWSMALEALVGEVWPDVAIELDGRGQRLLRRRCGCPLRRRLDDLRGNRTQK